MNKLYEEEDIREIANSIRAKNGSSDTYKLSEMASAIDAIQPESYWENPTISLKFANIFFLSILISDIKGSSNFV